MNSSSLILTSRESVFSQASLSMKAQKNKPVNRREEYLKAEAFRYNAFMIIKKMASMSKVLDQRQPRDPTPKELMVELLHSIFVLGKINTPPVTPKDILSEDADLMKECKSLLPLTFDLYSSEKPRSIPVPRRGPFSCVLDMVVHDNKKSVKPQTGLEQEKNIMKDLQDLIKNLEPKEKKKTKENEDKKKNKNQNNNKILLKTKPLKKTKPLVSTAICVSQSKKDSGSGSERFYGVSVSIGNPKHYIREVLIGASCHKFWHEYVADAVMTFYPEPDKNKSLIKTYFDGKIKVPGCVRCETFDLYKEGSELNVKPPCPLCCELFGFKKEGGRENPHGNCDEAESLKKTKPTTKNYPHGNCAEAESLSNLFKEDEKVRKKVQPTSDMYTKNSRTQAVKNFREALWNYVEKLQENIFTLPKDFKWGNN
ncbi:uncharacterized protein LOC120563444 [Perca fluviatilis]|uniref:uncharacterized protein LOC120563444 n=1 Tax=Perca fluviatilis TaxID=8168 RepID=UPI0019664233|nr:uncharacterized protein LOC120563444 [Perca fluviatilis]XP_039663543.1 uncharacterized protein LOC120563444 [Perca fluviatilis]